MNCKEYRVQIEISGRRAMFKEPGTFRSFSVPPRTAAEGIFRAFARLKTAYIRATSCRICSPVRYMEEGVNYFGPYRKGKLLESGGALQRNLGCLFNVCYQLEGVGVEIAPATTWHNQAHHLQEMFTRRLRKGQVFGRLCLGTSDYAPNYCGPWRPETQVVDHNEIIYGFPVELWDAPLNGKLAPAFDTVRIEKGVLTYA